MRLFMYFVACAFSLNSSVAGAGLFDDLNKMGKQLQLQLEQGGGFKIPSPDSSGLNVPDATGGETADSNSSIVKGGGSGSIVGCTSVDTVECACKTLTGFVDDAAVLLRLPRANVQVLSSDFSMPVNEINTELVQPLRADESNGDVASLELYRNAFETAEIASLYSQFLETAGKKADFASILKQLADEDVGFQAKKKPVKYDAMQAYGIILLYYQSRGSKASTGFNYLKTAAKERPKTAMIATYQLGHRAYFAIGEARNLSKAAAWMGKAYEVIEEKKREDLRGMLAIPLSQEFHSLVTNEFMSLVSEPDYARRDMYAELIKSAKQMEASVADSMRNSSGKQPELIAIQKAFLRKESEINAKILRAIGQEERATIEEQRLQKFVDDQAADAEKYDDYEYTSSETREFLTSALANINKLDDKQKKIFSDATGELALLAIESNRIRLYFLGKWASGNVDILNDAAAGRVIFDNRNVACNQHKRLNAVSVKLGAPKASVVFNSDSDDTMIKMTD